MKNLALSQAFSMASWVEELLNESMGYLVLKSDALTLESILLKDLYLPGLIRIPDQTDAMTFCFDQICHPPVSSRKEVLSLFLNYHLHQKHIDEKLS
jgi:hypothetical protein